MSKQVLSMVLIVSSISIIASQQEPRAKTRKTEHFQTSSEVRSQLLAAQKAVLSTNTPEHTVAAKSLRVALADNRQPLALPGIPNGVSDSEDGSHSPAYLFPFEDSENPYSLQYNPRDVSAHDYNENNFFPHGKPVNWSAHFETRKEYDDYLNSLDYGPHHWRAQG